VHFGARILKRVVEHEYILVVHIFSGRAFLEHFFLSARQTLEDATQQRIL
jgi:hypothetical protein